MVAVATSVGPRHVLGGTRYFADVPCPSDLMSSMLYPTTIILFPPKLPQCLADAIVCDDCGVWSDFFHSCMWRDDCRFRTVCLACALRRCARRPSQSDATLTVSRLEWNSGIVEIFVLDAMDTHDNIIRRGQWRSLRLKSPQGEVEEL